MGETLTMADWKDELSRLLASSERERKARRGSPPLIHEFLSGIVVPAFDDLGEALRTYGRSAEVMRDDRSASILVSKDGKEEFYYEVGVRPYAASAFRFPATPLRDSEGRSYRAEARVRSGPPQQDLTHATRRHLIDSFLRQYERHLTWHL
jgi:hypothetical protein